MARPEPLNSDRSHDNDTLRWLPKPDASLVGTMQSLASSSSEIDTGVAVEPSVEPKDDETVRGKAGDTLRQQQPRPLTADRAQIWQRLKPELQDFRASEQQAWCGLDENLLARYLAGQCSAAERQQVEAASQKSESVRDCLALVTDMMSSNV